LIVMVTHSNTSSPLQTEVQYYMAVPSILLIKLEPFSGNDISKSTVYQLLSWKPCFLYMKVWYIESLYMELVHTVGCVGESMMNSLTNYLHGAESFLRSW
jgi:hypothetical protein